jgi:glycosyltransferase involved in cell wall biosynthesis
MVSQSCPSPSGAMIQGKECRRSVTVLPRLPLTTRKSESGRRVCVAMNNSRWGRWEWRTSLTRQVSISKRPKRACVVRQNAYSLDLLVRREAEALRDDGFQVDVICQRQPGCEAEEVIDGVHVYRLPVGPRKGGLASSLWSYISFFLLAGLKLSVLHLRHPYDFLVFATLIPRLMGARVGLFMYEPMPELWATQYHERYGHDTMLHAIKLVRDRIPSLRLHILGRGPYLDKFLELEQSVSYLGWVSMQEMVEELHNAEVGIVAQKSSPYSNLVHTGKMYDYMAFSKLVVASRLKAVRAYFGEDCLQFFEPGNAEDLARAILDLYQHPDKRKQLVRNAGLRYEQYKWERQRVVTRGSAARSSASTHQR